MRRICVACVWTAAVLFCVVCAAAEDDAPPERKRVHEWPNSFDKIGAIELPIALRSAAFSPDGKRIVTSDGESCALRILNAETGAEERTIRLDGLPVCGLKFTPDGRTLLMRMRGRKDAGEHEGVAVLDMAAEKVLWSVKSPKSPSGYEARPTDDSPDGRFLAVGDNSDAIQVWDLKEHKLAQTFKGQEVVLEVVFSSDSRRLLSHGLNGKVQLWDVATGRKLAEQTLDGNLQRVGFSLDNIATAIVRQEPNETTIRRLEALKAEAGGGPHDPGDKAESERLEGIDDYFDKTRMSRGPSGWMWPGRTEAVSPDGKRTLTTVAGPCFGFLCIAPRGGDDWIPIAGDGLSLGQNGFTLDGCWAYAVVNEASSVGVHDVGNSLAFWDAKTGTAAGQVTPPKAELSQIAWSTDGKHVLLMGEERAWLWRNVILPLETKAGVKQKE